MTTLERWSEMKAVHLPTVEGVVATLRRIQHSDAVTGFNLTQVNGTLDGGGSLELVWIPADVEPGEEVDPLAGDWDIITR